MIWHCCYTLIEQFRQVSINSHTSPLSSDELLKQLHWLPIEWHIWLTVSTCYFDLQSLTHWSPAISLLQHHEPTRSLLSSSPHQLSVPGYNLTFGSRAFRFSAPRVWNSLLVTIPESQPLSTCRRHLISQPTAFQLPTLPRISSSACPDSSKTSALCKSRTD